MREWKKIGCAIDFSEPSRTAMEEAAMLARRLGASLTLVHVVAPLPAIAEGVQISEHLVSDIVAAEHEDALSRWRTDAEASAGAEVGSKLLFGEPAGEIVRHAREEGYDALVLGSHGRSGLSRALLGSVAEHVLRHAGRPVLVVRDHELAERDALAEEAAQYH
jgi:nucleotide-binding universal stress UspA family protein